MPEQLRLLPDVHCDLCHASERVVDIQEDPGTDELICEECAFERRAREMGFSADTVDTRDEYEGLA